MGRHDDPQFSREFESLVHLAVVDAEEVPVSEEDFEGGDSVGYDFTQLRRGAGFEFRDGHVEGVVAGACAFGFRLP